MYMGSFLKRCRWVMKQEKVKVLERIEVGGIVLGILFLGVWGGPMLGFFGSGSPRAYRSLSTSSSSTARDSCDPRLGL